MTTIVPMKQPIACCSTTLSNIGYYLYWTKKKKKIDYICIDYRKIYVALNKCWPPASRFASATQTCFINTVN